MVLLHNSVNSVTTHEFHEKKNFMSTIYNHHIKTQINSIEKVSLVLSVYGFDVLFESCYLY